MSGLSTLEAYERWAPRYDPAPHNPLMAAEQRAMLARMPDVAGATVLDLACGTGRYARLVEAAGAARVVGVDFSTAMLARAAGSRVRGDLTALPFRSRSFDAIVSGLALGHAHDLERCVIECARVLLPGGTLLYSDFHPEAARAGLKRAFRDASGAYCELPRGGYALSRHRAALDAGDFGDVECLEIRAGVEFQDVFPGADEFYRTWLGTPLFFVIRASALR